MMVLGVALLVIAGLLLVVTVGHDARTDEAPAGAGASLLVLIATGAVVVLATTGAGLVGITWVLSITSQH